MAACGKNKVSATENRSGRDQSLGSAFKKHFSQFFEVRPERLHFTAHSHHPWPNVSRQAHLSAWEDANDLADSKWERIFGEVIPRSRGHLARILGLSDPESIVFAPNTHEFVVRILSCFEKAPVRILTTGSEFHSFARQRCRWEESGQVECVEVPTEPFETFPARFAAAAEKHTFDLIFLSRVFFDSGFAADAVSELLNAVGPKEPWIVLDGYHEFMARPTSLGELEDRCFYLAGAYKYAMSGEGACFLHCPSGYGPRPVNTGWFAGFGALEDGAMAKEIPYAEGGQRFAGATVDPTAFYRFNAVMDLWENEGLSVDAIHGHVRSLQGRFLEQLASAKVSNLSPEELVPGAEIAERGNFLTFRTNKAGEISERLESEQVMTDFRGDRLRFGFGIYHDESDIDALMPRLVRALSEVSR